MDNLGNQRWSLWNFIGMFVILLPIQGFWQTRRVATLAYTDFKALLVVGKVRCARERDSADDPSAQLTCGNMAASAFEFTKGTLSEVVPEVLTC